jgi:hypothetical protein
MARIRSIKPEFWKNETLGELSSDAQLLFIGLWNLCDRRGFTEYRPKRIKAELFPYRDFDVESNINILLKCENQFIRIIEYEGKEFLHVINFVKHQVINIKEAESNIPKEYWNTTSTVQAQYKYSTDTLGRGKEGKGKEGEGERKGEDPPSENSENFIISFKKLKESLTGEIFQEQVCARSGYDLQKFKEFVDRWLGQKEMTKDYMYTLPKMRSFLIMDYEKSLNGKGRFQPVTQKPVNCNPGEYWDDSEFDENGMLKPKIAVQ